MIDCLRTRVHKQPIIAFYFESEFGLRPKTRSLATLDAIVPKSHMLTDKIALERTHVPTFDI